MMLSTTDTLYQLNAIFNTWHLGHSKAQAMILGFSLLAKLFAQAIRLCR
jgi:hypothetical protein